MQFFAIKMIDATISLLESIEQKKYSKEFNEAINQSLEGLRKFRKFL